MISDDKEPSQTEQTRHLDTEFYRIVSGEDATLTMADLIRPNIVVEEPSLLRHHGIQAMQGISRWWPTC